MCRPLPYVHLIHLTVVYNANVWQIGYGNHRAATVLVYDNDADDEYLVLLRDSGEILDKIIVELLAQFLQK